MHMINVLQRRSSWRLIGWKCFLSWSSSTPDCDGCRLCGFRLQFCVYPAEELLMVVLFVWWDIPCTHNGTVQWPFGGHQFHNSSELLRLLFSEHGSVLQCSEGIQCRQAYIVHWASKRVAVCELQCSQREGRFCRLHPTPSVMCMLNLKKRRESCSFCSRGVPWPSLVMMIWKNDHDERMFSEVIQVYLKLKTIHHPPLTLLFVRFLLWGSPYCFQNN